MQHEAQGILGVKGRGEGVFKGLAPRGSFSRWLSIVDVFCFGLQAPGRGDTGEGERLLSNGLYLAS